MATSEGTSSLTVGAALGPSDQIGRFASSAVRCLGRVMGSGGSAVEKELWTDAKSACDTLRERLICWSRISRNGSVAAVSIPFSSLPLTAASAAADIAVAALSSSVAVW